jgi:hypothetical protein
MESTIRLFADDSVIYRKIIHNDRKILQKDLDRLGEWAVDNAMKINPSKSKEVRFTRVMVKGPLNYSLMGTLIPEASSCKFSYLGIILRSDLRWADQVNYTVKKAWKALHLRILKKANSNTKSLAYMSLVPSPILEYGAACWDPYREGQEVC